MREIKFRAWDKINKRMWQPHKNFSKYLIGSSGQVLLTDFMHCDDYILMQFTGLQDKNGKDIYEGDILEFEEDSNEFLGSDIKVRRKVGWQNYYGAGWHFGTSWKDGDKRWSFELPYDAVVIGNIHENKHLTQPNEN